MLSLNKRQVDLRSDMMRKDNPGSEHADQKDSYEKRPRQLSIVFFSQENFLFLDKVYCIQMTERRGYGQ